MPKPSLDAADRHTLATVLVLAAGAALAWLFVVGLVAVGVRLFLWVAGV